MWIPLAPYPSCNILCINPTERAKTNIPRAHLRSYNERPRHLCKVTRAFLPRAQEGSRYVRFRDGVMRSMTEA